MRQQQAAGIAMDTPPSHNPLPPGRERGLPARFPQPPDARVVLRILYLHQHFSTPEGSTGTRSFHMAGALAAAGHDVTVACGRYQGAVSGLVGPFQGGPFRGGWREGPVGGFWLREYAIACGFPAHSANGHWIGFDVSATDQKPSLRFGEAAPVLAK